MICKPMKTHASRRRGAALTVTLALALALAALAAQAADRTADRTVDQSGRMPADGRVSIENIAGKVDVVGWDKAEIQVTGTLGEAVEELEFKAGERSQVKVVYRDDHRRSRRRAGDADEAFRGGADLTVRVPDGCRLDVEVVSADVRVSGLDDEIEVTAVSGGIEVRGACRALVVQSVSGSVEIDGAGRRTEAGTVSGSLTVRCDDADLEVETVTGDAQVECAKLRSLKASTVNGTITMKGRPGAGARIEAESINGSLTLAVPADVSAAFDISTFNGDIENAFGQKPERADKFVPGQGLKFANGGGDADVRLNTLNGKIRILKN